MSDFVVQYYGVVYGKLIKGSVEHIFNFVTNLEYRIMKSCMEN
jgi:hypothetical protein